MKELSKRNVVNYRSKTESLSKSRQEISYKFLSDLDTYLLENGKNLKCQQIAEKYFDFWGYLKNFKGNSNGFTGLSEFLILRLLLNQLGNWEPKEPSHSKERKYFKSNRYKNLCVFPEYSFIIKGKTYKPDIVIYESESSPEKIRNLLGIIEVKVYLTNGRKTADETFKKLSNVYYKNRQLQSLLIVFERISPGGKVIQHLKALSKNDWFDFCSLRLEKKKTLWRVLQDSLDLNRISNC